MFPAAQRIRSKSDFHVTVRSGVRCGRRNLVLYAFVDSKDGAKAYLRTGFIVSKAIGKAVTRNLVKRRLRAIVYERREEFEANTLLVIRALPAAGRATFDELAQDYSSASTVVARKLEKHRIGGPTRDHGTEGRIEK